MQRHVKRRGTAKTEMRSLGRDCPRLAFGDRILTKDTSKRPALGAVAFGGDFWVVLPACADQLWTVTEQETG